MISLLSDTEDEEEISDNSAINKFEVEFKEEFSPIPVKPENRNSSNNTKYYNDELGIYHDLESGQSTDWVEVNILPKIQSIFDKIANIYFREVSMVHYAISWGEDKFFFEKKSFSIILNEKVIYLNKQCLLLRPRMDLISVLLHILIHLHLILMKDSGIQEHNGNFRKLMKHFNAFWRTQINVRKNLI